MKIECFPWITIKTWLLLGALVAVAMTVSACGVKYLPLDTPEAPVYNAFWALKRGDFDKAGEQYTDTVRAAIDTDWSTPGISFADLSDSLKTDGLLILGSRPTFIPNPNRAVVTFKQVGFFFFMPVHSSEREVFVARTEEGWKLVSIELFGDNGSPNWP
jgi:hypothetical protein